MPFDPGLDSRLEELLESHPLMQRKKMFGGVVWMLSGNMCVGVHKEWLIIRVGVEAAEKIADEEFTKPMDFTGKVMKGWVMVAPEAIEEDKALSRYVELAMSFVKTLPAK